MTDENSERYDQRTYFKEHEQDDVKGFIILSVDEGGYFVGEKWLRSEQDDLWESYHVGEAQLANRVRADKCEPVGQISQEQFEKVLKLTGADAESDEVRKLQSA